MKQNFYVWNWIGGGFNQTYAKNRVEALNKARETWPDGRVDLRTFRELNAVEERRYWVNFPAMD